MKNIMNITVALTHAATFHSDETLGVALLHLINPHIEIVRTLDRKFIAEMQEREDALIFDIGLGEYDHHQPNKALRPDGTPYCAAGLLWRDFGHMLCPTQRAWQKVDHEVFLPVDKADNGVEANLLSVMISNLNPAWDDADQNTDHGFWNAVEIMSEFLAAAIKKANAEEKAREFVLASRVDSGVLVLNQYLPWQQTVIEELPEISFVVFPSNRGGFNIQTVPVEMNSFTGRVSFPSRWLGNPDASIGMTFCHPGNFLASTETLEQAIAVAKIAIAEAK